MEHGGEEEQEEEKGRAKQTSNHSASRTTGVEENQAHE